MMVKDLIEELKTYNPNAEVTRPDSETIELSFISVDGESKMNAPIVFIEARDYVEEDC